MKKFFLIAVSCVFLTSLSKESAAAEWSVYTSDSFTFYSDAREKSIRKQIVDLELFRAAVLSVTGLENRPENQRMIILQFRKAKMYKEIAPENSAGFYLGSTAGPRMVIGGDSVSWDAQTVLFHEYVHYLMREHSYLIFPKWYVEGFAEVLSNTTLSKGKATVGGISDRIPTLHRPPRMRVEELLKPRYASESNAYWHRFYAFAWLLTHRLQLGSLTEDQELRQQTSEYIIRVQNGDDPIDAFSVAYRMTPAQMDSKLQRYLSGRKIPVIDVNIGEYNGTVEKRTLDSNEQAYLLADLASRMGKREVALEYLESTDPHATNAGEPVSLRAVLLNHKGWRKWADWNAAHAPSVAPDNSVVLTNLARFEFDRYHQAKGRGSDDAAALQQAIDYATKGVKADPENLEAYNYLWMSQLEAEQDQKAINTMTTLYEISPSSQGLNLAIGSFAFDRKYYEFARPFLRRVLIWSHTAETRQKVQGMLSQIDEATTNTEKPH